MGGGRRWLCVFFKDMLLDPVYDGIHENFYISMVVSIVFSMEHALALASQLEKGTKSYLANFGAWNEHLVEAPLYLMGYSYYFCGMG